MEQKPRVITKIEQTYAAKLGDRSAARWSLVTDLTDSTKSEWIEACREAVQYELVEWLRQYWPHQDSVNLCRPLSDFEVGLSHRVDQSARPAMIQRAEVIAGCALVALALLRPKQADLDDPAAMLVDLVYAWPVAGGNVQLPQPSDELRNALIIRTKDALRDPDLPADRRQVMTDWARAFHQEVSSQVASAPSELPDEAGHMLRTLREAIASIRELVQEFLVIET